ncbi:MAG TPA: ribonuclease R [Candidatus Thiothrix moscowensis]|uniref:ribonuclease R n=1 Tax=unclassified Thiothrix TaxID=2636184 RepID=UPI0025E70F9E|nr:MULTISPECIES: ribonuclease R [unclassified Thiothrix]HRJ53013.1 ribonuclease R [Candidatus Thiothrix moscowensis]HRJ92943.1 ribonuclease R [Candidatus Thiothrix moscowensis]
MKVNDPHSQREAEKYDNPIPSRELILQVLDQSGQPLDFADLSAKLHLSDERDLDALKKRLRAMERDGQLLYNRRRQYVPIAHTDLIAGRVIGHPDGFGFLKPDDGTPDLFLHAKQMRSLLHGDRALVSVRGLDPKGRREGAVVEILERGTTQVVGRYFQEGGVGFVAPDNSRISQDILIPSENKGEAKHGQIVVAAIVEQPSKYAQPKGKIVEVLGDHMAPGMEIDVAIRSHQLPFEWSAEISEESDQFGYEVPEDAKQGRVDLRNTPLVTIDGEDAKDFDDAVYCEREGNNWRLLVAIADVSHYVRLGMAIDKEATERGTSVYFPGKVIPMLPEILSNGLCSLNPHVDRLCMVCEVRVGPRGKLLSYQFMEGVMHSAARLTYTKMAKIVVDRDAETRNEYSPELCAHLDDLYALYKVLRKARDRRGAIDFETEETRIIFDAERKIEAIVPTQRNDAHKLIEECMILANVCAAKFLSKHRIPALHRVHDGPTPEKLADLRQFLSGLGLSMGGGDEPTPADYTALLDSLGERPDRHMIQTVLLRSMSQAVYSPEANGHFGLAQEHYAHFTSPIRRYPDLLVHRAIRHILRGGKVGNFDYKHKAMMALGEHCSMTERRADDATRDVTAWLKCEYMQEHVGDSFSGVISGVTGFGLFVELSDIYVEGLVHITALTSDYYHFDPARHQLTGENSGRIYRLGDTLQVTVARVDLDERKIDFVLAKTAGEQERKPAGKSRKSGGKSKGKQASQPAQKPAAKTSAKPTGKKPSNRKPRKKKPKT